MKTFPFMNKDPFEFHRRLHLQKITEDLPYRLAGINKEKKIVNDSSSESSDEFTPNFKHNELAHDPERIKKAYTFSPKKKKSNNIKIPKTALSHRKRIDVDLYFSKSPKNHNQIISKDTINNSNDKYDLYNLNIDIENNQKSKPSYSNFDSSKSEGRKNIYPFLTEFDYESEEEKLKREHLENIHISGTSLVPSSCKELQVPSEFRSLSHFSKPYQESPKKDEFDEGKYQEIENWQNFIKNEEYVANDENSTSQESKHTTENNVLPTSTRLPTEIKDVDQISDDVKETKFKELLKNAKPKAFSIDSNLQEKVTNRVLMKKKTTAAIHNASVDSHLSQSVPFMWPAAKKSLVVVRHEKPLHDYLEKRQGNQLMANEEIISIAKTLQKVEKQKKIAKEKQKIPDWARGASDPILMTAPKKTKIILKSKRMKEIDYLV